MAESAEEVEVTRELTESQKKALLKEAEQRFRDDISKLMDRKAAMNKQDVLLLYDIGVVARKITDDEGTELHRKTYGARVVEDVASFLGESKQDVFEAIKIARLYSADEMKQMVEVWPRRALRYLIKIDDKDTRDKFQKAWESGKKFKNSDEFNKAVQEYQEAQAPVKPEGKKKDEPVSNPVPPIKRAMKSATAALTKTNGEIIPELLIKLKEYEDYDFDPDEKTQELATELREQLPLVKQLAGDIEKAMKRAGI